MHSTDDQRRVRNSHQKRQSKQNSWGR